jgi:hypothetical protein
LPRELACADQFNASNLGGHFTDAQLWKMATLGAANVARVGDLIGSLDAGKRADVAIFDGSTRAGYRALFGAAPDEVLLVLRSGVPLYGDDALVTALSPTGCEPLAVCGASKQICTPREFGMPLATLMQAAGTFYPLFFCGTPDNEPTCVPSRPNEFSGVPTADDPDGDGLPGASDDCPTIFNPPRLMDAGKQADADSDGAGDLCDAAPLDPTRQ